MTKSKKYTIYILILLVLSGLGILFLQNKKIFFIPGKPENALSNVNRSLTKEAEKIYYSRIKIAEENLKTLKPEDKDYKTQILNDYNFLAQQYFGLGKLEKSREYYMKILEMEPKSEFAAEGLAYIYLEVKQYGNAIKLIEAAIENNPQNFNLWIKLIDLQTAAQMNNSDLDKIFISALDKTGRHVNIVTKYAMFQESLGKVKEAIKLWQEASKLAPEMSSLYDLEIARLRQLK
jgi:tetratricopeptide (TPR) repeat protein